MSKHSGKKDREDKARRRLVKAQLELHTAQEQRAEAIARAEGELERARQRGSKWVARATERVERRAGAMARAEAHLLATTAPKHPARALSAPAETASPQDARPNEPPELTVSSPSAAADVLERQEAATAAQRDSNIVVVPDGIELEPPGPFNGNESSEDSNRPPW